MLFVNKFRHSGLFIILLIVGLQAVAQPREKVERPRLVIGIVVDQMRWDYLYRYYDLYREGGFRRLLNGGYKCQNMMINYLPTYTAPGHTCIYTGSVPAIHGITGNDWTDNLTGKHTYCVEDSKEKYMTPNNLLTTTVTDELRLATNFRSRVYGVALKDRGSILPAGHLANAAYWYDDKAGGFTSSRYYSNPNPPWLQAFNARNIADSLVKQNWELLYDISRYTQSTADASPYEKGYAGESSPVFPHIFDKQPEAYRKSIIKAIPAGNTYSIMMAEACIDGEQLGLKGETDFLALSLSSTDYIGHQFGINSVEAEDCYLRLDRDLARLLAFLDAHYGRDGYLLFLTADHGAAHNPGFLDHDHVPAGVLSNSLISDLNASLKTKYGKDSLVSGISNYQLVMNNKRIDAGKIDRDKVKHSVMQLLSKRPEISYVIDMEDVNKAPVPEPLRTMIVNGYYKQRCADIQIILDPAWYDAEGKTTGTTHGNWNPYDAHIPFVMYGWTIPEKESFKQLNMTDISATIAALLHIQMPSGCIGKPIIER